MNKIKKSLKKMKNKKGFTLIEILVAVVIIATLAAIAVPGYRKSVEKAKAVQAVSVLNDAAKAEQDFALVSSRYTKYWDDLIINQPDMVAGAVYCVGGTNTENQDDCENDSTYKVKLTVGNPDSNSVVMATRMPNNPYADYKLFKFMSGDPNIYCKAATTSQTDICQILGFPTKNLPNTRNIDRQESINCATELHGGLSNASKYTCERVTYDDGSFDERAYKANGDLYDLFTFDSEGKQTGDIWYENDGMVGFSLFRDGENVMMFNDNSEKVSVRDIVWYAIMTFQNGKRQGFIGYHADGSISNYRHYINNKNTYYAEYNDDGSIQRFTCYDVSCGGKGSCSGTNCASSVYAEYIPNSSDISTSDSLLNDSDIEQICQYGNNLSFC